ncbi:MAG: diguanylate cyclase [Leptonema illini]|uniref:diguanylate cyclase n=1 Tax=Leptonema illini TaxID=183 RepID=A0A833LXY6_9LEPT|nr:MAG: diguanylate cyclase [Leptonema illini]PKL33456.1 MAG: hypothetical protein CVV45_07545 [Spirochaetae bacterium HGW-Spirochaetae-10]
MSHSTHILLVEPDDALRFTMEKQIGYFGFSVQSITSVDELRSVEEAPAVLVISLGEEEGNAAMAVSEFKFRLGHLPILFLSDKSDFETRLQIVRLGGTAFLQKPAAIHQIVEELDRLSAPAPDYEGRILFVENGNPFTDAYAKALREAGLDVYSLFDPADIDVIIDDFVPDLILLNLYYPECLGMEMAAILRQKPSNASVPIVFLSREQNLSRHLAAIQRGGDDFFIHPVDTDHLVTSLMARIRRTRVLRELTIRDAMTGLLNHSTFNERLEQAIRQHGRNSAPFAFAMVDIDNFKRINDGYGHAAGDQAIRNLARTLKQSLRPVDTLGRFGGEEFAILMPVEEPGEAFRIMDGIRQKFSRIQHSHGGHTFQCTFSCGIAMYPDFSGMAELGETADEGLYIAKDKGRNSVILIQKQNGNLLVSTGSGGN